MKKTMILFVIPIILGSSTVKEMPVGIHYPDQRVLVDIVLKGMDLYSAGSAALVLRTGAVESLYHFREALNEAPERGYWQIHPQTALDILERYLQRPSKIELKRNLESMLGYEIEWLEGNSGRLERQLRDNDILGIALCRIWYGMAPYYIPRASNVAGQAWLWKRWFNTTKGAGSVRNFILKAKRLKV